MRKIKERPRVKIPKRTEEEKIAAAIAAYKRLMEAAAEFGELTESEIHWKMSRVSRENPVGYFDISIKPILPPRFKAIWIGTSELKSEHAPIPEWLENVEL